MLRVLLKLVLYSSLLGYVPDNPMWPNVKNAAQVGLSLSRSLFPTCRERHVAAAVAGEAHGTPLDAAIGGQFRDAKGSEPKGLQGLRGLVLRTFY